MATNPVNIILIGYRATGKTTVGRLLADRLGFSFVDVDQAIEQQEGRCIADMVQQHGWDYFRQREKEMLVELADQKNHVIATGGGAILHQDIWPSLKQSGLVIWLKADIQTICRRLANDAVSDSQRPSLTGEDIQQEVSPVLRERTPLYETSSHLTLDATDAAEDIITQVMKYLKT
ncbi:MAG: shikimate kinase AroL [Desulfobulbaceae bacterium]|jgi:shikimate kinase|nr:shikimate kinase AroL [Desulfobulbaceae bacterium]